NLMIDGATKSANGGERSTTGPIGGTAVYHSVVESAGTATSLADYNQAFACLAGQTVVTIGANNTIAVADGQNVVCTITNTRQARSEERRKGKVSRIRPEKGTLKILIDGTTKSAA